MAMNAELTEEIGYLEDLIIKLGQMLREIVNITKGPPEENSWHSTHDAVESVERLQARVADLEQAVSVPEWIKCSERLPESGITVLVSNNSGAIYTCRRSVIERKNLEPDGADFTRERFTHWMPLPCPPKQEGE